MAAGLLASLFGSSLANGLVPGAIAAGAIALFWIPLVQTVETVEDLLSPLVSRIISSRNPARVLVAVETGTLVCAALAVVLALLGVPPWPLLLAYLLVTSVGPLVIDVAEEMFAGQLAQLDRDAALAFNVQIYVAIGIFSTLIARPLGAGLAGAPIVIIFALSGLAALIALILRLWSIRTLHDTNKISWSQIDTDDESDISPLDQTGAQLQVRPRRLTKALSAGGPGSPLISGLGALAAAIPSTYVALWVVAGIANPQAALAAVLVVIGVGSTVGPLIGKRIAASSYLTGLRIAMLCRTGALLAIMVLALASAHQGYIRLIVGALLLGVLAAFITATAVLQATARQISLAGRDLSHAIGWSHSLFAAGALLGTWIGLVTASWRIEATLGAGLIATIACATVLLASRQQS